MSEPGKALARAYGAAARAGARIVVPTPPVRLWVGNVIPALAARTAQNRDSLICLLILLLAGCASGPRGNGTGGPDWEGANKVIAPTLAVAPAVAPSPAPILA